MTLLTGAFLVFYLVFIAAIISILRSYALQIEKITLDFPQWPAELNGLKIALLSDLHWPLNMIKMEPLLKTVSEAKPDLIMLAGDMFHKKASLDSGELASLLKQLGQMAPVFAVPGNHEKNSPSLEQQREVYQACQVPFLENQIQQIELKNCSLEILGFALAQLDPTPYQDSFFPNKLETNLPKILLSHQPERWEGYCNPQNRLKPDLVLCGHAHGGQFRLPKAIYAPQQGMFPQFTSGLYRHANGTAMVVSRGLGYSSFPFRINNRIHLPIITIKTH